MAIAFPALPADWPFQPRQGSMDHFDMGKTLDIPGLGKDWAIRGVEGFPDHISDTAPMKNAFGRGGVLRAGDMVIRPYRRGGLLRHFNQSTYLSTARFEDEFAIHRALWLAGFPTVEPLGYAFRKGFLGFEGLFFTRFEELTPWPRHWEKDFGFVQSLEWAIAALNLWQVHAPDLNATNVMVTQEKKALILDWDRAVFYKKKPAALNRARLLRSLVKLEAPEELKTWANKAGEACSYQALPDMNSLLRGIRREQCQQVRTLAHALRNPLSSIMLQVDLTEDEEDPAIFRTTMNKIRLQSSQLKDMIAEFTEMSLLDADMLSMRMETEPLDPAIQDVLLSMSHQIESKAQTTQIKAQRNIRVYADAQYLRQIIRHILNFTITYAKQGLELALTLEDREGKARFTVEVPELEILDSELSCLFTRFFHPSNRPTGGESHLGIGLFLAKSLAEKMGGTVGAESVEGITRIFVAFDHMPSKG